MNTKFPLPAWRTRLADYPFASHFMPVKQRTGPATAALHYLDEGTGDPILMVHGNPTWSFYYRHLVKRFSQNHRALAVDHIGCGLSEKPGGGPYRLGDRIDNLVEFVQSLDLQQITLLVHDWGGAIGVGAALRDLSRYRRFVLFNTAAFPPPFFPWRIRACRFPILGRCAVQGLNLFARAAITQASARRGGLPKETSQGLLAPYDNWRHRRAIYDFVKDIPTSRNQETWKLLDEIEGELTHLSNYPVKLIWGMRDWCFRPECLRRLEELLPHAQTCEIADAGHYVVEDATDQIIAELESFLHSPVSEPVA